MWKVCIPSFRISGHFPSFRLLGFRGIFRHSAVPRFHLLGFGVIFRRSAIPSFRIWVIFRRSVIPWFRHSAVPSFRLLGSPGNREVLGRSRSSFTALTETKYWLRCFSEILFCSCNIIEQFERFKFEDNRSAEFKRLARSKPESNQCFEIFDRTSFTLNLKLEILQG